MPRRSKSLLSLLALVWLAALSLGLRSLSSYENTPGSVGVAPSAWPAASKIRLSANGKTLVMVAHPLCPCSRASVAELARIMAAFRGKVRAYVLFWTPQGGGAEWEDSELRRSASQIPGVTVLSDVDGVEAKRFGAETSGDTLLFSSDRSLLFSGGITESRGQAGDNAGENAIVSLATGGTADRRSTFVFGCSLAHRPGPVAKRPVPN